jgi:cytochrome oxidase Cu insertion factor (SCO1/SenC/PrrC family)
MWRRTSLVLALGLIAFSPLAASAHSDAPAVTVTRAPRQLGGSFTLTDQNGHRVSDTDFVGRLRLVYFGYSHCADACPLDLQNLAGALDLLGERRREVAVTFITIDPARDTAQRLQEFLPLFDPDFIGLTGDAAEIRRLATAYGVDFQQINVAGPDSYDFSHLAIAFLMGREGEFLDILRPGDAPPSIASVLQRHLGGGAAASTAP